MFWSSHQIQSKQPLKKLKLNQCAFFPVVVCWWVLVRFILLHSTRAVPKNWRPRRRCLAGGCRCLSPLFAYSWGRDEDDGLVCSFLAAAVQDGTDNKKCIPTFNIFTKIRHDNKQLGNANVANCFPLLLLLPSHPPRHPRHSAYLNLVLSPKERSRRRGWRIDLGLPQSISSHWSDAVWNARD